MMFYKTSVIILVHLIVCCALTSSVVLKRPYAYNRPIEDVNDSEIQDMAKFAIAEEKWSGGPRLQFERVIEGEELWANGELNYRLILEAIRDGGKPGKYETVVRFNYRQGKTFYKLISFRTI